MTPPPLPVIFRTQRSGPFKGTVTAVFPDQCWDYTGRDMTCFDVAEGHGGCSRSWYRTTRPATESEAADTLATLRRIYETDAADAWAAANPESVAAMRQADDAGLVRRGETENRESV